MLVRGILFIILGNSMSQSPVDEKIAEKKTAFEFPCDFPIKIVGHANEAFESSILAIISKYYPNLSEGRLKQRTSHQGKYLAFTITVHAESQSQLDNIYQELTKCPEVIMAL